jgi:lipoate-protein ligase A
MQLLELTLDTPAENIALDEALLLSAEEDETADEVLRLWEPRQHFVVLGSSSRIADEVNLDYCKTHGIEIVRRTSGGAAIVAGPGCLMYSLVLSLERRPELWAVDRAHRFVLQTLAEALGRRVPGVARRGTSDLAVGDRKFSGNSLRLKRRRLIYHGTLLYDFPLDMIAACLRAPPRQPDYRCGRGHGEFVTNIPLARASLREVLVECSSAGTPLAAWPSGLSRQLAADKFRTEAWTSRL